MEKKVCQSCGMTLGDPAFYGTNSDDSRNEEYCIYCFAGGEFNDDLTLDEMIDQCADMYAMQAGGDDDAVAKAKERLREYLPTLKRWQQHE